MDKVLIEKCLDNTPNKFELSILVMNRAKEILAGSKTNVETTKYTKKSINKALKEIQNEDLDIESLKERIKANSLNNNLFLKEKNKYEDTDVDDSLEDIDSLDDIEDEDEDSEEYFEDEELEELEDEK